MSKNKKKDLLQSDKPPIDLSELFPPLEHGLYAYYGRIGQGKTYAMTADILQALARGNVVYTNYPIDWRGYDERDNWSAVFLSLFFVKNKFYQFSESNLRRIEIDETFHDTLSTLTDCIVALDEGYVAFDSYEMTKMSMKKRKNVLHTRHFDRSIWYTTQRPNAVHVTMRAQTNVFYKVTKLINFAGIVLFRRQELDLGSDDSVDENEVYSTKFYLGKSSIFEAYDTKYLRQGALASQQVLGVINGMSYIGRIGRFIRLSMTWLGFLKKAEPRPPAGVDSTATALKSGVGSILQTPPEVIRSPYTKVAVKHLSIDEKLPF